jgi:asparagine synthase (glutamine-hydrolysing)
VDTLRLGMCGIAGTYVGPGETASRTLLLAMAGELHHRGPDGTGLYLDQRFGMVSNRLAIVDLEGGNQPLSEEHGRFWAMQNGEVYNYVELREELRDRGHRFRTTCDTEVIVHAYEEWGAECLHRFNGDFAIAVWDRDRRELFLARDRFGVRPVFLAEYGGDLCFASEAKALLRHPRASRTLDPAGVVETFALWANLPDRSAFAGIRELPPAHYLVVGADGVEMETRWWDLDFTEPTPQASDEDLIEELRDLLAESVRIRLRADVPVAAYVSGGLDSSAIAAIARDQMDEPLVAFGVGFSDERFDESEHQRRIASQLGIDFHQTVVDAGAIAELLPRAIELGEKPILRTAPTPLLRLSASVRDAGLKVVTTGEGADELFAGYDIFREDKVRRFWAHDADSHIRPLLFGRLNRYLATDPSKTGAFLRGFYGRGLLEVDDPLYSHRLRFDNTSRCLRLFRPSVLVDAADGQSALERLRARLPERFGDFSPLGRAQYLEIVTFLEGYLLHSQGDRMLMGHSIEGRFPFLDYRVAELATRLPSRMRLRGLDEKHALRRAVANDLPKEIVSRSKRPYRAPIGEVFAGPNAPEYVDALVDPRRVDQSGLLDPAAVGRLIAKFKASGGTRVSETDEMALVGLISLMLLHERFVASPTLASPVVPTRVVIGRDVLEGPLAPAAEAV